MKNLTLKGLLIASILILGLASCKKEDTSPQPEEKKLTIDGLVFEEDFTDELVFNQKFRVYSKTNLNNDNYTLLSFTIPENTIQWSYWFVVQQGEEDPLKYAVRELSSEAAKYTANPLTALGLGLISYIPALQEYTETLDFYMTNQENLNLFLNEEPYSYYDTWSASNTISIAKNNKDFPIDNETIHIIVINDNLSKGLDAYIEVRAFVKK